MKTLRATLADWTDQDGAAYLMSVALGLMNPEDAPFHTKAKHVFWSAHPVGEALHGFLETLAALGVLERRDEPDVQYRWNREFRGSWI